MHTPAEAAIRAGDDVLTPHQSGVLYDAVRYQPRVLHHIGGVADDAWH